MAAAAVEQPIARELPRGLIALDEPFSLHQGRHYAFGTWWRYADRLAEHFPALTICVPLAEVEPEELLLWDSLRVEGGMAS